MEGRRKAPLKTYGKSATKSTKEGEKMDSFDYIFGNKTSSGPRVPPIEDPFDFSPTEKAPPQKVAKPDPFAFSDEDFGGSESVKQPVVKKPSNSSSLKLPPAPRVVTASSKASGSALFGDSVLKVDRQMKIDSFAVSLPRLKPSSTTSVVSSHNAPSNRVVIDNDEKSKQIEEKSIKPKTTEPPPPPPPSVGAPISVPVLQKSAQPQRMIFTTDRGERRKVANPKSWFAEDDDEEEAEADRFDSEKPVLKQKSVSTSAESVATSSSSAHPVKPKRHASGSSDRSAASSSSVSKISTVVDSATGKRSVRVARSEKDNFAVVKHVRGVSELQAEGSSLEYDGDYIYLIDCLGTTAQLSSRCLSALQLATKVAETSDFRLYLKSTGRLTEVFSKLQDADQHDLLALCSAAIFLVLSSDRSQVDLDISSLSLLVRLVKLKNSPKWTTPVPSQIVDRVASGVTSILKSLQRKYGADFGSFSTNTETPSVIREMALSALHTLCHRCSSETMQNEFRESGALEIIVDDTVVCLDSPDLSANGSAVYTKRLKQLISGISKLVAKNKDSKRVASECANSALPRALARFSSSLLPDTFEAQKQGGRFTVGENEARLLSQSYNLLMVLCCDTKTTCSILSNECPDFLSASVRLAIIGSKSLEAVHSHFDLSILSFFVLVNIFEYSPVAAAVSHPYGADGPALVTLLIEFFNFLCAAAVDCEREADEQISSSQQQKQQEQHEQQGDSGETVRPSSNRQQRPSSSTEPPGLSSDDGAIDAMLQAAGTRHMELNFLAACCCIVVFYATDIDPKGVESVRKHFSGANFDLVVDVLKRFLTFTALVNGADDRTLETVAKILEKYDAANRAAGFGGVATSSSSTSLPLVGSSAAPSSSNVAAGSSLNWATPPGTSGDDDNSNSSNHTNSNNDDDDDDDDQDDAYRRFRYMRSQQQKESCSTTAINGDDDDDEEEEEEDN